MRRRVRKAAHLNADWTYSMLSSCCKCIESKLQCICCRRSTLPHLSRLLGKREQNYVSKISFTCFVLLFAKLSLWESAIRPFIFLVASDCRLCRLWYLPLVARLSNRLQDKSAAEQKKTLVALKTSTEQPPPRLPACSQLATAIRIVNIHPVWMMFQWKLVSTSTTGQAIRCQKR